MNDFLLKLACSSGLERVAEHLEHFFQPSLRLVRSDDHGTVGSSRFGGFPDLPPEVPWPLLSGKPLDFLAQIRCSDIADAGISPFPAVGLLSFFYDVETSPWGVSPTDKEKFAILFHPDTLQARPASLPGQTRRRIIRPATVHFVESISIPGLDSPEINQLRLSSSERQAYIHFLIAADSSLVPAPFHQLFGHPKTFQGNVRLDCQLVSNGIWLGNPRNLDASRAATLASGAADWRMLLQIDSDPDLGLRFGNDGLLSFWLRQSDLQSNDFSRAWAVIQSP